jgi:tight adherence protein C
MNPITVGILSFLMVAGITFLAGMALLRWWPAVQRERLRAASPTGSGPASILRWTGEPGTAWERTAERIGRAVTGSPEAAPSKYRQRLIWAGYHEPRAVLLFVGGKVGLAAAAGAGYLVYKTLLLRGVPTPSLLATALILAVIGFFLPDFWLHNRIKARKREIVHTLPDVLDMLMVCVEAGMGFDAAVARVAEQPEGRHSPLHQEMLRMHLEVRAGRPRAEALRALGQRTGADEIKAMVTAFVQTEKLGTPLGKTLRVHADSARVQRRHRAEERAHLAPLKMLFPTVFFLMPSFFLVTMAPSLLGLLKLLNALSRH